MAIGLRHRLRAGFIPCPAHTRVDLLAGAWQLIHALFPTHVHAVTGMADVNGDSELETMDYCDGAETVWFAFPLLPHAVRCPDRKVTPQRPASFPVFAEEETRSLDTQAKSPGAGLEHFRGPALAHASFNNKFEDDLDERDMIPVQPSP